MKSKDPIENLFQENQHRFDESPKIDVWERIESKLDERQEHERGILLWWKYAAAAMVVLGLSFGLWSINESQNQKVTPQVVNVELQPKEEPVPVFDGRNQTEILDELEKQPQIVFEKTKNPHSDQTNSSIINAEKKEILQNEPTTFDEEKFELVQPAPAQMPLMKSKSVNFSEKITLNIHQKEIQFEVSTINDSTWKLIPINFEAINFIQVQKENDSFLIQINPENKLNHHDLELMKSSIQNYFNSK